MFTAIVFVATLLVAQGEGEGEGEGEPAVSCADDCVAGCVPVCAEGAVRFFDGVACADVVCADVEDESVCGEVSVEFGADCLLPDGAPCDPGYGGGVSRCASRACVEGFCAAGDNQPEPPLQPTPGTASASSATASTTGCLGCPATSLVVPGFAAALLRDRRRRR